MENHKQITKRLQETIDNAKLEGAPQIEEIAKLRRGVVRLRATTKEGAKSIREGQIKWEEAYSGVKIYKPKYGIVVHRVPTWAIDLKPGYENTSDYVEAIEEWQKENASRNNITISGIKPLARKPKIENGHKRFQSIIIFTEHADAADRCITNNFLIGSQSFPVEKYAPHLRVTQCFKCYGFGHTASNCNNKEQCGKCAHDHSTAECTSDSEYKCVNCQGSHAAWHFECPARNTAGEKVQENREGQSPFFCE
jgi:hypothetical protein